MWSGNLKGKKTSSKKFFLPKGYPLISKLGTQITLVLNPREYRNLIRKKGLTNPKGKSNNKFPVIWRSIKLFSKRATSQKPKYTGVFNRESFMKLISRVTRDNDLGLDVETLDQFITDLHENLKCSDFLLIANVTKKQLSPNENLRLFQKYQDKYTKAETAYLYLLFDYEMIDKAGEYLDDTI